MIKKRYIARIIVHVILAGYFIKREVGQCEREIM